ncbi:MAG TPA: SIR2 family protein [Thermopolyspora sp.]
MSGVGSNRLSEDEWDRLLDQLRHGDCTPFLGAGACGESLPTGARLSRRLAEKYHYPFSDDHDLTRVTQYMTMRFSDDAIYVKTLVRRELAEMAGGSPDFSDPLEPHALLASFPISVFLTTNYDNFLVQALKHAGKDPQHAICPWNSGIDAGNGPIASASGWSPRPEAPLVYHLHGTLEHPQSIVVTEDDYLEFVTSLAADRAILPPSIQAALTTKSLLFIGYGLRDATFRQLFKGLLSAVPEINRRAHVSVQRRPRDDGISEDVEKPTMDYVANFYRRWRISIYWGTLDEFMTELRRRMG